MVVSNTTPLNYLVLIGQVDVLPRLYGRVIIPDAVFRELTSMSTPFSVRTWVATSPAWLATATAPAVPGLESLHAGEREAILLAERLGAGALLMDERDGRREAIRRGLRVAGTLGVLEEAAVRGFLDLPTALTALQRTSFRASPALVQSFLDRDALRRASGRSSGTP